MATSDANVCMFATIQVDVALQLLNVGLAINAVNGLVGKHMLYAALLGANTITQYCS